MTSETSAEQLSIALMAEARSQYGAAGNGTVEQRRRKRELADRLAQWATDVRKLGVDWFTTLSTQRMQISEIQQQRDEAREAVQRQRDALAHWEDAARDLRAILENPTCRSTGEVLVALHERLHADKLPPFVTTGVAAKLARVRELLETWQTVEYGQGFVQELREALDG